MKKLTMYYLLALTWLVIGSCKDKNINGKCEIVCECQAGSIDFGVGDVQGKDYFEKNPHLATYDKFMVYDDN